MTYIISLWLVLQFYNGFHVAAAKWRLPKGRLLQGLYPVGLDFEIVESNLAYLDESCDYLDENKYLAVGKVRNEIKSMNSIWNISKMEEQAAIKKYCPENQLYRYSIGMFDSN